MNKLKAIIKFLVKQTSTIIILIIGIILGIFILNLISPRVQEKTAESAEAHSEHKSETWTCSMHPQIRQPKFGKCPICFMDLINAKDNGGANSIKLSKNSAKVAEVEVYPVERKFVEKKINLVGKVDYDETRVAFITARMAGRVDKLFVDYTGMTIKKDYHLAEYYSPELIQLQQELLMANPITDLNQFQIVTKKLKLWGLTDKNLTEILNKKEVSDRITLYSPIKGIVTHKLAMEGKYFKEGDKLFTVADLSKVWIKLSVYEPDLTWIKYGQKVLFNSESYPGESFEGIVSFISPIVNDKTRTIDIRVVLDNPQLKLKPNSFINATISAKIAESGNIISPDLANKWICPMHYEIIKEAKDICDICKMDLVKAETLGYENKEINPPLVIPASAPLITGKRAIVYLQKQDDNSAYYGQEIELGLKTDNYYIVKSGLKEGDLVVVNGNFKIDSALQLAAKPSMMSMPNSQFSKANKISKIEKKTTKASEEFISSLDMIYNSYFKIHKALSKDNFEGAIVGTKSLKMMLGHISSDTLIKDNKSKWNEIKTLLAKQTKFAINAKDIKDIRIKFEKISDTMYKMSKAYSVSGKMPVKRFFCPMAFDNKGAFWLQQSDDTQNPYYGDMMYGCGEKKEDISK